jgi:peptidoglycan/LPS O-acetylase OafA/YrhL
MKSRSHVSYELRLGRVVLGSLPLRGDVEGCLVRIGLPPWQTNGASPGTPGTPETVALERDELGDRSVVSARSVEIDALRGLAALAVVVAHAAAMANPNVASRGFIVHAAGYGGTGVLLFFVLSGYLVGGPFVRALAAGLRLPPVDAYSVRRAARILPAYWVAFAAILVAAPSAGVRWWEPLAHGALVHSWIPGQAHNLYFVAWSLGDEATFYVLVPIAVMLVAARSPRLDVNRIAALILLVWACSLGMKIAIDLTTQSRGVGSGLPFPLESPLPSLGSFCPGLLVALATTEAARRREGIWVVFRRISGSPVVALGLVGALLATAATAAESSLWIIRDSTATLLFLLAYGILLAAFASGGVWTALPARLLAPVGVISYGIYLWHWVVKSALESAAPGLILRGGTGSFSADLAVLLVLTIPLATLSWLLVERPAIRWAAGRARQLGERRVRRREAFTH